MIFTGKNTVTLLLMLSALLVGCSSKEKSEKESSSVANTSSSQGSGSLEDIDGFWVSEKYISALIAKKTPFAGNPEFIEIDVEMGKLEWTNFHEAYHRNIFGYGWEGNRYYLKVSGPDSTDSLSEQFHFSFDGGALVFSEAGIVEQFDERFVKITSELPVYANKQILAGKYRDSEGKPYEFTENGQAIWPELSFDYKFVLDSTEANCPYIYSTVKDGNELPRLFGYKWEAEHLYIYEIIESEEAPISCAAEAFLTLVKE